MMISRISLLVFCVVIYSTEIVRSHSISEEDIGNANDFVDTVLENLKKEPEVSEHLDPLKIPDVKEDKVHIRNIIAKGLLSLHRSGDCTLSYNNETVRVIAEIAIKDVTISMDYSAKALFFWIHGEGDIDVSRLAVKLDFSAIDGNAELNSLKVAHLGDYHVRKITGLSFALNWLLKIIANSIAKASRPKIVEAIENEAAKALGEILKKYKIPIY